MIKSFAFLAYLDLYVSKVCSSIAETSDERALIKSSSFEE